MEFTVSKGAIENYKADIVAIGCFENEKGGVLSKDDGGFILNKALKGEITRLIEAETFKGEDGAKKLLFTAGLVPARYILLLGLGKRADFTVDTIRSCAGSIAKVANEVKATSVALVIQKTPLGGLPIPLRVQALVEGIVLGSYKFDQYKKENNKKILLKKVCFLSGAPAAQLNNAISRGLTMATAVNLARDMGNMPSLDLTPTIFAKKAGEIALKNKLTINVMNEKRIRQEKMGAFLSIAKGSDEPPVFIHLSYKPAKKAKTKVAIIGKGITFDSGGISLKPHKGMEQMKDDMAGAAAALVIMQAVAQLKLNVAVEVFIPACENMPSGKAIKPGDIVRARNGKTIEIISTDAEGRMILSDALVYASETKPDYMIDLATLTGHCAYAIGERYAAILGNDQKLVDRLIKSGACAGEKIWQFPLENEYKKGITKGIADLNNEGTSKAGIINGALFLQEFVGKTKWAHMDIASVSWSEEDLPYIPRGSTGFAVRTLLYFLLEL